MSSSEKIPLHLLWFFLRIRKHCGEKDYFVKRFENMDREKCLIEVQMVGQLHKRGLIMLPEMDGEKVFDPLVFSPSPGMTVQRAGTEYRVNYWKRFELTPAGKYLVREMLFNALGTVGWTVFVAAVSAATALFVAA